MKKPISIALAMLIIALTTQITQSVMQVYDFPNQNNFILSDITYYDLNTKFALFMKTKYLGQSKQHFYPVVNGSMLGEGRRSFIVLPVKLDHPQCQKSLNVIFKIDTGVSGSSVSREVADALYAACLEVTKQHNQTYSVKINQQPATVTEIVLPLQLFNTLGADYLFKENIELIIHYLTYRGSVVQMRFER